MIPQRVAGSSTLAMLEKVRQMKAQGMDVVSFAAGESDFPTPDVVIEEAYREMRAGNTRYVSTQGVPALREALAADAKARLGVPWIRPEHFLIVAGAKQGIHLVLSNLCETGDEILIPAPYWVSYPGIAKALMAVPKTLQTKLENRHFPSVEELEAAYTPRSKALLMASPSNPTGLMIEKPLLEQIIGWCERRKVLLVFDELYERLTFGRTPHVSALSLVDEARSEWVVSVNAFSKTLGMTGWRLGWVASHATNIARLSDLQSQVLTCLPGFAQVAAAKAMKDLGQILKPVVDAFGRRKKLIVDKLRKISGLQVLEPEGAFYVLVNVEEVMRRKGFKTDQDFVQQLLENEQVVTVAGSAFGAPHCFRISFAMSENEINKGLERIARFCQ